MLPEGTRLVHIGPPKTGTTAVQGAFHARRREVLAQGVRYAGRSRHSGSAVLAVSGRPSFRRDSGSPPIRRWEELAAEVRRAREPRLLVSSEFFADAEADRIPRIVDDLGREHLHVVVTLRPLARILASQWQQYVQSFMRLSYDAWLDGVLNQPRDRVTPTFWRRHRHDELIERWAAVVGPERLTAVVVDEANHDHILRVFEQLLGLRPRTLAADDDVTNRSMTLTEIEAVRAFNNAYWEAGLRNALFHRVLHFGAAPYMKQRRPAPDEARIETPQWALDRCGEIAREMVASIAASGVRVVGELGPLAIVPTSSLIGDHQPEVCVPPDIAAAMTMGMAVVSGAARGNLRVNPLAAGGGVIPDPSEIRQSPAGEPAGLSRFATGYLADVIGVRLASGLMRWLDRLARRGGRTSPEPGPTTEAATAALDALSRWLGSSDLPARDQTRIREAAAAGLRWASATGGATTKGCVPPGVAAGMALGVLVERGLALETAVGKLQPARLAWAEPPELAVVSTLRLAEVVVRRTVRGTRSA